MYANYHTHTYHCKHATGTPEEYVKEAIQNGMQILGFSDHNPCVFDTPHTSWHRMGTEETETYVSEITALKEKYQNDIRIFVGYEAEYYPRLFDATLSHIMTYGCDYLLLGQHFINNEYDGLYVAKNLCDEAILHRYVEQSIEGMRTGVFSAVAHPDVILYGGDMTVYEREMTRLCEAAQRYSLPMEFNLHGYHNRRHYPHRAFWEIVKKTNTPCIIGCDAHDTAYVAHKGIYLDACRYLGEMGITPIKTLELKPVKR